MSHHIDLDELSANERYKLLTALVIPRPIAWVTTADLEGNHFATNNLYTIIVYYSDFEGYDRVIGFAQWNSNQQ